MRTMCSVNSRTNPGSASIFSLASDATRWAAGVTLNSSAEVSVLTTTESVKARGRQGPISGRPDARLRSPMKMTGGSKPGQRPVGADRSSLGLPPGISACLFDLDGVLTQTARVHARVWKDMFDAFLKARADRGREPFRPFDEVGDYDEYVDGKPREEGVSSFLAARHITLPEGSEDDTPEACLLYTSDA